MAKIDDIKNKENETIYPRTLTRAVYEEGTNEKLSDKTNKYDTHIADDELTKHRAKQIELQDTANLFASTNVEEGMSELFSNVSNGKDLVSGAITGVDDSVVIPTEPSFSDLAGAIGGISTGKKWASGIASPVNKDIRVNYFYGGYDSLYKTIIVDGLGFKPSLIIITTSEFVHTDHSLQTLIAWTGGKTSSFVSVGGSEISGASPYPYKLINMNSSSGIKLEDGSFVMPWHNSSQEVQWIAFE